MRLLLHSVVEWFKTSAPSGGLCYQVRRPNPGCWLKSEFEILLVVSLFQDPIGYRQLHWSDMICALLGLKASKSNPLFCYCSIWKQLNQNIVSEYKFSYFVFVELTLSSLPSRKSSLLFPNNIWLKVNNTLKTKIYL